MENTPELIKVKALDITPYNHGLWCSIEGGEPFVNEICHRKWSEDGSRIWFMLDSHNFFSAAPNDIVESIVKLTPTPGQWLAEALARDSENMRKRPTGANT